MRRPLRTFRLVVIASAIARLAWAAEDVDSASWNSRNAWVCARSIAIESPHYVGEFKPSADRTADDYARQYTRELQAGLRSMVDRIAILREGEQAPPGTDFVIKTEVLKLARGSRAARFWVGFGAGHSTFEVSVTGSNPETQQSSFVIQHGRASPFDLSSDAVATNVSEVVEDLVAALRAERRGTCEATRPPASQPEAATAGYLEELRELAKLHDQGILTDAEFTAKKEQLLGLPAGGPVNPPVSQPEEAQAGSTKEVVATIEGSVTARSEAAVSIAWTLKITSAGKRSADAEIQFLDARGQVISSRVERGLSLSLAAPSLFEGVAEFPPDVASRIVKLGVKVTAQ